MNIYQFPYLFSGIIVLLIGLLVLIKNRHSKLNIVFFFLCFNLSLWMLTFFTAFIVNTYEKSLFLQKIGYTAAIIAIINFFQFIIFFIKKEYKKLVIGIYFSASVFIFFLWGTTYFIKDIYRYFWGYYPIAGVIHPLYVIWHNTLGISAVWLLYRELKRPKSASEYIRQKYGFWSLFILFLTIVDYLPNYKVGIYPFGSFLIFIFIAIFAYAIIKHRLLDIRIAITRAGIFIVVYTFVLGIPFWIGYQTKNWLIPTFSMFVLSTSGPLIYRYFQGKAENIILANQRHYQRLLLESAKGMLRVHDLDKLLRFITDIVKKIVKVKFAVIVLKESNKRNYILKAIKGDKNFPRDFILSDKDPLIKFLKKRKSSLIYDEINYSKKDIVNKQIQLIVPILMENNLLGFLGLGEKEDHTLYTQDDINVFEILTRQAALAIDHCNFMEEFSKAQEKAFQAEKLASIGGMADGVAHQMKNRLNLFSIVSGEMRSEIDDFTKAHPELVEQNPDLKRYFDYLNKTGDMLISNVRKTNGIIEGILSFARAGEKGNYFSEFSFGDIIDTSIGLLLIKHQLKEFPLEIVVDSSDFIYGVKSQFLECIYNILDNCYEAIKEKMDFYLTDYEKKSFKPSIKLKLTHNEKFYQIEISDNGTGIKDENRQKIFAPFFTTKPSNKSGSGVGMYVVKRIIEENHKGKIKFESKYMEGTKFFIKLPKNMDTSFKSTRQMSN